MSEPLCLFRELAIKLCHERTGQEDEYHSSLPWQLARPEILQPNFSLLNAAQLYPAIPVQKWVEFVTNRSDAPVSCCCEYAAIPRPKVNEDLIFSKRIERKEPLKITSVRRDIRRTTKHDEQKACPE